MTPQQTRIPNFKGALNFRDMGGYQTSDGRRVRWNQLYRSGTTHAMSLQDFAPVVASGIRFAYDLRSNSERRDHPSRFHGVSDIRYWFRDHERIPGNINRLIRSGNLRAKDCRDTIVSVYRQLPYDFSDAYSTLFRGLAAGELPLVFNCTAGKDRTGVAAALVLTALGVRHEQVYEDYLLTRQFFDETCELLLHGDDKAWFAGIDRAIWEPMLRTEPDYLDAMFEQLIERHGSVQTYLREVLGADDALIEAMRNHLLERETP